MTRDEMIDVLHRYKRGDIKSADDVAAEMLEPYPLEFVDRAGHPGKLVLRNGEWFFNGVIAT